MKRLRILATLLVLPMVLTACLCGPEDEGDYEAPEEAGSIRGPNASAPSIQFDGPYVARIG